MNGAAVFGAIAVFAGVMLATSGAATYASLHEAEAGQPAGQAAVQDADGAAAGRAVRFGGTAAADAKMYGALQSTVARADQNYAAGMRLVTMELAWGRYEPTAGDYDAAYVQSVKSSIAAYRAKGMAVVLSLGVQYPPDWLLQLPHARFVNQYGDRYVVAEPGKNIGNLVFNQALRDRYEAYMRRVFGDLGTDFSAVRLGGGWYDELNYPEPGFGGRSNAYWAFDDISSGRASGLAAGQSVNPVPGWTPGVASPDHAKARQFADWYMDSLKNYHDWQIATARKYYPGNLTMMYPSWGVRPGQLDQAVTGDLAGSTPAERNGEVQRGFDFARYIAGIRDPKVIVYTTWLDAPFGSDDSADEAQWRPVHWLSSLAQRHPLRLRTWGENTGGADHAVMQFTFDQAAKYGLMGVMWAFEPQLYDGRHATIDQLQAQIDKHR